MSVTVVGQTSGAEVGRVLLAAGSDFADMMRRKKQLEIDQMLAESRIQESQLQQQSMELDLQMKRQQVNEITAPQEIQRRERMRANDEAISSLNVEGGKLRNQGMQLDQDFAKQINPLKLKEAEGSLNLMKLNIDSAKKNLDYFDQWASNKKEYDKAITAMAQQEALAKGIHVDAMKLAMPEMKAAMKSQFEEQLTQAKMRQQALEQGAKQFETNQLAHKAQLVDQALTTAAKSSDPARALDVIADLYDMPQIKGLNPTSRGAAGRQLDPDKQMFQQILNDARSGDTDAQGIVKERILQKLGHKPETADEQMKSKLFGTTKDDSLRKATEAYVNKMMQKAMDPKDQTIPSLFGISDDIEREEIPNFKQVSGSQPVGTGKAPPSQAAPIETAQPADTSKAKTVSGEYSLKTPKGLDKFVDDLNRLDYHFSQHSKESKMTHNTNQIEGSPGKAAIDKSPVPTNVRDAIEKPFGDLAWAKNKREMGKTGLGNVTLADADKSAFQSIVNQNDPDASIEQQARFTAIVRELARIKAAGEFKTNTGGDAKVQNRADGSEVDPKTFMESASPEEVISTYVGRYGVDSLTPLQRSQLIRLRKHFGW